MMRAPQACTESSTRFGTDKLTIEQAAKCLLVDKLLNLISLLLFHFSY
jgi:hypothetical protein